MLSHMIKHTRESKGMTLKELGKKINKTEATVQRYESGTIKNITNEVVEQIADALDVSPAYLMGWTEISSRRMVKIPILGIIKCGDPILAEENTIGYREELDDNIPKGKLFYLKTKGDSMVPTVPVGSYVLIRVQDDVENGEIAAVLLNYDTEATLKRVKRQGNLILLSADNKNYDPYVVDEDNPIKIIGKAVKISIDL